MANLTRDLMVAELQSRGWSRFVATDLERYLDWALQDIYGMAKFDRSTLNVYAPGVVPATSNVPFSTISGSSAELVHQIKAVFVGDGTHVFRLEPANEEFFLEVMWLNSQLGEQADLAPHPTHYYVFDRAVFLYPIAQASIPVWIHHLLREDVFSGASDTTALPERFDKAVIAQAEVHCNRRAHDYEGMGIALGEVSRFMMDELGMANTQMDEDYERVVPWR